MSKTTEDAGAAKYGNFINYYSFNSATDRIQLLPTHIWKLLENSDISPANDKFLVLDIGCNAGNFTQLLYPFLQMHLPPNKRIKILGIDIDPLLIDRCIQHNQYPDNVQYACIDIMECDDSTGHLNTYGKQMFDATFCLSLTMWIHLNNGDSGLLTFLNKVHQMSRMIIIEPQPWKCYLTAVRRMKRSANKVFDHFATIAIRNSVEEDIQRHLEVVCERNKLFETIPTKWNRKIAFYVNKTK